MGRFITGAGYAGTIGGNITVFGTSDRQIISVADVAGTVTFDPSFNKGGDTIVLAKSAAAYTINQSGSTVVLSDGDSRIVIPLGIVASTIQFSDGDRTLLFSGGVKIGSQVVTATAATVTAEGTAKSTLAADAAAQAARLVLNGESAWVGGNATVYGSAGVENVSIVGAGKITFDPSFNRGGDTISLAKAAQNYSAQRVGSLIVLQDGTTTLNIPVGTVGLTAEFRGDNRKVMFANGEFKIGSEVVSTSGTALTTTYFKSIMSPENVGLQLELKREAFAVQDVNGDGIKDLLLANSGNAGFAVKDTDPRMVVFFGNADGTYSKVDTSNLNPLGWVNDFIFLDSDKDGIKEILAIDHNREEIGQPLGVSKISVYEWDGAKFQNLTSSVPDNLAAFWHNGSVGDLNGDGLLDFSAVTISADSKIFLGSSSNVFSLSKSFTKLDFGSTGATVVLEKEKLAIFLPFDTWDSPPANLNIDFNNLEVVKDGKIIGTQDARTGVLPPEWGYSFALSKDLNGDGRTDFIALAEDPGTGATGIRIFVTFMQKLDGTFDIFNSFPNESQLTDPKRASKFDWIWSDYKFQLADMDGDGKTDLFWGSWDHATPTELPSSLFFGDGTGRFYRDVEKSNALFKDVVWKGDARTFVDDVNGDGLGDLVVVTSVWTSMTSQTVTPMVFLNHGTFG